MINLKNLPIEDAKELAARQLRDGVHESIVAERLGLTGEELADAKAEADKKTLIVVERARTSIATIAGERADFRNQNSGAVGEVYNDALGAIRSAIDGVRGTIERNMVAVPVRGGVEYITMQPKHYKEAIEAVDSAVSITDKLFPKPDEEQMANMQFGVKDKGGITVATQVNIQNPKNDERAIRAIQAVESDEDVSNLLAGIR